MLELPPWASQRQATQQFIVPASILVIAPGAVSRHR